MTDSNKVFRVIAAATDQGGARKAHMFVKEWVLCGSIFYPFESPTVVQWLN